MNVLGIRIKERREAMGLSQEELAKKLGYKSRSTIAKIESGENDIPQSKIKTFADILDVKLSYLMGWDEEEEDIYSFLDQYKKKLEDGTLAYKKVELTPTKTLKTDFRVFRWEELIISYFRDLNNSGMKEAIKRIEELTHLEKYTMPEDGRNKYPEVISVRLNSPGYVPIVVSDEVRADYQKRRKAEYLESSATRQIEDQSEESVEHDDVLQEYDET